MLTKERSLIAIPLRPCSIYSIFHFIGWLYSQVYTSCTSVNPKDAVACLRVQLDERINVFFLHFEALFNRTKLLMDKKTKTDIIDWNQALQKLV